MDIGRTIRELRAKYNKTQDNLADYMGTETSTISKIESGNREVKVKELVIIANFFGISEVDLIGYPDKYVKQNEVTVDNRVTISIEVKKDVKDEVMRLVFGDKVANIL